jgi:hypothetical protein
MHPQNKSSEDAAQEAIKKADAYLTELRKLRGNPPELSEDQLEMAFRNGLMQAQNERQRELENKESAQDVMNRVDTYRSELEKRWGPREPLTEDQQDKFETEFHNAMRMRRWPADQQAEQKTRLDNRWSNIYKKILGIITNLLKLIK